MRIIVGGRGSGKTTGALKWLAKDPANRIVICPNFVQTRVLTRMAERVHPGAAVRWEDRIVDAQHAQMRLRGMDPNTLILVEELDSVLGALFGRNVEAATVSADVELLSKKSLTP